ncbi:MAG: transposase [Candidatus Thermochlorobacter aerophilum]|jgi:transposase|uniref:Transposase n=1 Tax=Candidatus Thermochlorobacter aerophilus TaxID=1868324 RepID=A0A395M253_9BACT|nr:MAG: transposase [Candidatus Thermochlorobacter aerophilum]
MKKHSYPSDLTDSQWEKIAQFFDTKRSRKYPMRQVCNAIIYVVKTGCQWRQLPKEFGAWSSIYYYFDKWRHNGLWERLNDALREAVRVKMGREATPSAMVVRHFVPIPKRWVVERTFAWFESYRRLSKDFEFHPKTSQTMIYIASVRLMLNRLT